MDILLLMFIEKMTETISEECKADFFQVCNQWIQHAGLGLHNHVNGFDGRPSSLSGLLGPPGCDADASTQAPADQRKLTARQGKFWPERGKKIPAGLLLMHGGTRSKLLSWSVNLLMCASTLLLLQQG